MNKVTKLITLSFLTCFLVSHAQAGYNCNIKRAKIQNQIEWAKAHGNQYRVAGLQRALNAVNARCGVSDYQYDSTSSATASYSYNRIAKLQDKIQDKREDLIDLQEDLAEATAVGKTKKIAKYNRKIAKVESEIAALQSEINAIKG